MSAFDEALGAWASFQRIQGKFDTEEKVQKVVRTVFGKDDKRFFGMVCMSQFMIEAILTHILEREPNDVE